MRTDPTFRRVLLCLLSLPLLALGQTSSISTEQYLRQLQDLNAKIAEVREHPEQAKAVEDSVPDRISINCKSGECSLSYEWLKKDLKQFQKADPQKRSAFLDHERAKSELKSLVPEDAKEAIGHGVRAKRSKSGAVSFDVLETEATHAAVQ